MYKLLITLGHNSSAILVRDKEVLIGYEEERLSKVKADGSFPKLALSYILDAYPDARTEVAEIHISHWFWDYKLMDNKYYDSAFLKKNFIFAKIRTMSPQFTHHDAHANSVWNFCSGNKRGLTVIADGFGNRGECLSMYRNGHKIHRSYAIEWSLGLMYQYATAYLGMKEFQDEYKLLGYEQQCTSEQKTALMPYIKTTHKLQMLGLLCEDNPQYTGDDMGAVLGKVRAGWYARFEQIDGGTRNKAVIGKFVQQLLEKAILQLIGDESEIMVGGGVFYNVKLNNAIVNHRTVEHFEAHPLCGDQGCALGMVDVDYNHLFWGKRGVYNIESRDGYTQVQVGDMEFGPRALGNTSTIAEPTSAMVEKINMLNGRDTVMPMAPIVTDEFARENFRNYHKIGKCKHFMIVALDYMKLKPEWRGAAHIDTDRNVHTGRPQVIDEYTHEYVTSLVSDIMINTSLNAHGQPIIYNDRDFEIMENIQRCHKPS